MQPSSFVGSVSKENALFVVLGKKVWVLSPPLFAFAGCQKLFGREGTKAFAADFLA
jgi:hypothetical protein